MAGAEGIEPSIAVLETAVIPLNYAPRSDAPDPGFLFRLLVGRVLLAKLAILAQFKFLLDLLLVALGVMRETFAFAALELDEILLQFRCHISIEWLPI